MALLSEKLDKGSNIHCLVYPGFDYGEHKEFEESILDYIEYIANFTNDILLIITDGERFDINQLKQLSHIDIIKAISLYISLKDGLIGDFIDIYDDEGKYSIILSNNGLTEKFYSWCEKNIDMSELNSISNEWRKLKNEYLHGKYNGNKYEHEYMVKQLEDREYKAKMDLDIKSISYKAIEDFGVINKINLTSRNICNEGRFFRFFQHAINRLGKERVNEIFITDGEHPEKLPIVPVSHFRSSDGEMIPTSLGMQGINAGVFNASEISIYGNSAELLDNLTYELSVSRYNKFFNQKFNSIIESMGVKLTKDTKFIFLGEYRHRCVNNVLDVMKERLGYSGIDNFYITYDNLTLQKPSDFI